MQYYVPQFIESESKVIGPLSLKQFFLIAGPITFVIVLYFIFRNFIIAFTMGVILIGAGVAFAFYKFEGQDLLSVFSYGINFLLRPKKFIWAKKGAETAVLKEVEKPQKEEEIVIPFKTKKESNLQKLAWEIETKTTKEIEEKFEDRLIEGKFE